MRRLWLMLILALFGLSACGIAPPTQIAQSSASPSTTVTATGEAVTGTAEPTSETSVATTPATTATTPATITATPEPANAATSTTEGTTPDANVNGVVNAMVEALNEHRSKNNCPALAIDDRLQQAAQNHADDMADRRRVDHLSADGTTFEQRLERAEYPFQRRAEILALGLGINPTTVVNQWLSEPEGGEHRGAILDCEYRDVGVGFGTTEHNVAFWVVDFGQQKP